MKQPATPPPSVADRYAIAERELADYHELMRRAALAELIAETPQQRLGARLMFRFGRNMRDRWRSRVAELLRELAA